jgi:hypothetical protein
LECVDFDCPVAEPQHQQSALLAELDTPHFSLLNKKRVHDLIPLIVPKHHLSVIPPNTDQHLDLRMYTEAKKPFENVLIF